MCPDNLNSPPTFEQLPTPLHAHVINYQYGHRILQFLEWSQFACHEHEWSIINWNFCILKLISSS